MAGTLKRNRHLIANWAFSKFGGDLDAATKAVLDKGARNVQILIQPQFTPYTVEKIAIIYLGTGLINEVPVHKVREFEEQFLLEMESKLRMYWLNSRKGYFLMMELRR